MWAFFGRMFGSQRAMDTAVDGVVRGLDKIIYTSEEKADARAAAVTEARSMVLSWMDRTQGQNVARRFLAVIITFVWLLMYMAAIAFNISGVWASDEVTAKRITDSADLLAQAATEMNGAMMLILGFYFAAPHLSAIIGPAMSRFSSRPEQETPSIPTPKS